MRRWVLAVAALGFAHAAGAAELNSENLRGLIVPTFPVMQTPAQAWELPGPNDYEPAYQSIPTPAGWTRTTDLLIQSYALGLAPLRMRST